MKSKKTLSQREYSLDELLSGITPQNCHAEIDAGAPVGMETSHLLKSPANAKHLEKSLAQSRKGQAKSKAALSPKESWKGVLRKPTSPVSIQGMNRAIEQSATHGELPKPKSKSPF